MNNVQIISYLSDSHLFSRLPSPLIQRLASTSRCLDAPRGTKLFNCYDNVRGFYLLLKGQVKLGVESFDGKEKILHLIHPSQSFGEDSLFLEKPYSIYAHATIDSKVLFITKDSFLDTIKSDAPMLMHLIAEISARNHQLIGSIASVSLESSTQRLIGYLLQCVSESQDSECISFPADKRTVASILSFSPETLSREIKKLTKMKLIKVNNKEIITNVTDLRNYSEKNR